MEHLESEPASAADSAAPLAALSPQELQLHFYFVQERRDAYCVLEVFDWLRRANRVDGESDHAWSSWPPSPADGRETLPGTALEQQAGIGYDDMLENLGFSLQPNCTQDPCQLYGDRQGGRCNGQFGEAPFNRPFTQNHRRAQASCAEDATDPDPGTPPSSPFHRN
ncbi:hypothetical protein EJB05_02333, partial [Eragrostis curvula]